MLKFYNVFITTCTTFLGAEFFIRLVMLLLAGVCKYDMKWWHTIWITAAPASPVPAAPAQPQPAGMSAKEREKLDIEQKLQQQREKEKAENTGTRYIRVETKIFNQKE